MSWALYDDNFPYNRKVAWLRAHGVNGIAALGLHLLLNTWCRHEGMQGFVPFYIPEQQAGKSWRKLVDLLADDGCGMLIAADGGWMINDYDEYGKDGGISADEKKARLSKVRAEAGRAGGKAKAANQAAKTSSKTVANDRQSSSPTPVPSPTNSPSSKGSSNAPSGALPRIIRAYVESAALAKIPVPVEAQDRVSKSAASLFAQGYSEDLIEQAARSAAVAGWTDLATQMQRDASRTSGGTTGRTSTTEQRAGAAVELAARLDAEERKAISA